MRQIVVTVAGPDAESDAELAADALWGMGVDGIEERVLGEGRIELRAVVGDERAGALRGSRAVLEPARFGAARVESVRFEDVRLDADESWRDHVHPSYVGDSVMTIPAWLDPPVPEGVTAVRIEPGASFGLGDHPTTRLSLAHLVAEIDARESARVLDVGCGSGILAITAVLRGAAWARGVDVSAAAVEAADANARRNGVSERVEFDTAAAATLEGAHDVVLANILAPTLVVLADDLRRLTAPGGSLIVSGVLDGDHGHVLSALSPMVAVRRSERDGWAAVTLRHAPDG